jgi:hypothetical protein
MMDLIFRDLFGKVLIMKITVCLLILVSLFVSGCDSSLVMTPRVSTAMIGAGLGLRITSFRTDGEYSGRGHGLVVMVMAVRDPCDYRPNLDIEIKDAAKMLAAIASCDEVNQFYYLKLTYINQYACVAGDGSRNIAGGLTVFIWLDKIKELREKNTPASEYPQHWELAHGFKDRLDSKESLWWRD